MPLLDADLARGAGTLYLYRAGMGCFLSRLLMANNDIWLGWLFGFDTAPEISISARTGEVLSSGGYDVPDGFPLKRFDFIRQNQPASTQSPKPLSMLGSEAVKDWLLGHKRSESNET